MIIKLLTEHHLEFLSLKEGCRGSSESTLVKMSNCWKSHALAHMICSEPSHLNWRKKSQVLIIFLNISGLILPFVYCILTHFKKCNTSVTGWLKLTI